jgi:hypothetical protein
MEKHSPCAQALVQTAWRGSARAAGWMLPEVDFTEHSPGAPHHGTSTGEFSCNSSTRGCTASTGEGARRSTRSEANGGDGSQRETLSRSPRRGRFRDFQLEALEEEVEAIILSKHRRRRSPESAGMAGRRRRRSRSPEGRRGSKRRATGAGLGRIDRPRPELAGLAEPGGPVGPVGLLGQQARWARLAWPIDSKTKL